MKLSQIIGKQVFVVYDGKFFGTVNEVAFDNKYTKIKGLYFFDNDENEYFLPSRNILCINDFVLISNLSKILNTFDFSHNLSPVGKSVLSLDGQDYGDVIDIDLDEKLCVLNFVTNQDKNINSVQIAWIENAVILGNKKRGNYRQKNFKQIAPLNNVSVSIMQIENKNQTKQQVKLMPQKITFNSDILLGKKLTKDVYGKNNELILKQNTLLSEKSISKAKVHNALNELYYNTI